MKNLMLMINLIYVFIRKHLSNICLFASILLALRYIWVCFSFNLMTLGVAFVFLMMSATISINDSKNKTKDNDYY